MFKNFLKIILIIISVNFTIPISSSYGKTITTSIGPIKFLVDELVGNQVNTTAIFPEEKSPHSFRPSPKDIIKAINGNIYFITKASFETKIIEKIESINPNLSIVDCSKGVKLNITHGHKLGHHNHNGTDHHIWTTPENLKTIATNIFKQLKQVQLIEYKQLKINYDNLLTKLDESDQEIKKTINSIKNKHVAVFHPGIGYFARQYGLTLLTIEEDGKFPSPKKLLKLIKKIKKLKIKKLFVRPTMAKRTQELLRNSLDITIYYFSPTKYNVVSNLRELANNIAK